MAGRRPSEPRTLALIPGLWWRHPAKWAATASGLYVNPRSPWTMSIPTRRLHPPTRGNRRTHLDAGRASVLRPAELGPVLGMAFASDGTLYVGMSGSSYATEPPHPNGPVTALIARTDDLGDNHQTFVVAEPKRLPTPLPKRREPRLRRRVSEATTTVPELPTSTTVVQGALRPPATEQTGFEQHRLNSVAVDPNNSDKVYRGVRGPLIGVPFVRSMIAVSDRASRSTSPTASRARSSGPTSPCSWWIPTGLSSGSPRSGRRGQPKESPPKCLGS